MHAQIFPNKYSPGPNSSNVVENVPLSKRILAAKPVVISRAILSTTLLATAALCGVSSYCYVSYVEQKLFRNEFKDVAHELLENCELQLHGAAVATQELATVTGMLYPYDSMWPNVSIEGFQSIGSNMADIGGLWLSINLPIVYPNQLASFESYALESFANDPNIPRKYIPYVWKFGRFGPVPDDGNFAPDELDFYTPILNIAAVSSHPTYLLYNPRRDGVAEAMKEVHSCCANSSSIYDCVSVTDFLLYNPADPGAAIIRPVFPLRNRTTLVGFSVSAILWSSIFSDLVTPKAKDLTIIVASPTTTHTYEIREADVIYRGEGSKCDMTYSKYKITKTLMLGDDDVYQAIYSATIVPSDAYYRRFHSLLPVYTCLASIIIMLLSSVIFFVHDYFVDKESLSKDIILENKKRYVRFISHEVRTPLNTVSLGLQLLEKHMAVLKTAVPLSQEETSPASELTASVEDAMEITRDVQLSANAAITVLNDLLNYDKIESNTMKFEFELNRAWKLFYKSIFLMEIQATQCNIKLDITFPDNYETDDTLQALCLCCDSGRIGQVIRNLISNALKFSPEGSSVRVRMQFLSLAESTTPCTDTLVRDFISLGPKPAGSVILTVEDSGPGISKENQAMIFGEGVQFNPNKLQSGQGAGLGLAIAENILLHHGGRVWVTSEGEGHGAEFSIELPVWNILKGALNNDTLTPNVSKYHPVGVADAKDQCPRKLTILIVDDVALCRKMLNKTLTRIGHICLHACDGIECLEIMKSNSSHIDCILMDNEMPKLSGPLATRAIREMGLGTLIVGVTGNVMDEDVKLFLEYGADHVLPKPFDVVKFEKLVGHLFV